MTPATDPTVVLEAFALLGLGYAVLGVAVAAAGTAVRRRRLRRVGISLAAASPLPAVLFGGFLGLFAVAPPELRRVLWATTVVGAWLPIVLSPPVVVAFLVDR